MSNATKSAIDAFDRRIEGIREWLRENHPHVADEQKHLDGGSVERAYWHYGYLVALLDARARLARGDSDEQFGEPDGAAQ